MPGGGAGDIVDVEVDVPIRLGLEIPGQVGDVFEDDGPVGADGNAAVWGGSGNADAGGDVGEEGKDVADHGQGVPFTVVELNADVDDVGTFGTNNERGSTNLSVVASGGAVVVGGMTGPDVSVIDCTGGSV